MDNDDCPPKCYCGDTTVTCDEAKNPVFCLNWRIETFYIQNSYLNNLKDVILFINIECYLYNSYHYKYYRISNYRISNDKNN